MPTTDLAPLPLAHPDHGPRAPAAGRDVDLVRRAMDERWPMAADQRGEVLTWLRLVLNETEDERTRVNAAKALLAADKLNLEYARTLLAAERKDRPSEVNVNVGGTVGHVHTGLFARIEALAAAFSGAADRAGDDDGPPG